jgi:hypothetical protein
MKEECCDKEKFPVCSRGRHHGAAAGGGAVYCFGLIGAGVYFLQHATTFGEGVLGILKSIVWPAMLVYKALELLKM